jgi:MFS family permease
MSEQVDRERRLSEPVRGHRPSASLPSPDAGRAGASSQLLPLVVLVVGVFMPVLDTSIVNVALPTIELELGVGTSDGQWVSTAYSLAEGVMVPISGWLGHRFGSTKVYLVCLGGFTIASALCGSAGGLVPLVAFRILQAIPSGAISVRA